MIEKNYKMVVILAQKKAEGLMGTLIVPLFTSPISLVLLIVIVISLLVQTKWFAEWQAKRAAEREK